MIIGSEYVESVLGVTDTTNTHDIVTSFDVRGVTAFFFALYLLMATQDIAVDGWALTLLKPENRSCGPVCNSIGQNLGYLLAFTGFLAMDDADTCETLWRPLLGLKSRPGIGMVNLKGFLRCMGIIMLSVTCFVALFTREERCDVISTPNDSDQAEQDSSQIGLKETYKRLWSVCKLPVVRQLLVVSLTFRFPTALSDVVKFLKAEEWGMSKQTIALLSPTIILPLAIIVPIVSASIWKGRPMKQFMDAYKVRVTLVGLLDVLMLLALRSWKDRTDALSRIILWCLIVGSTSLHALVNNLQFSAQMIFSASRVDPAIGGSYMALLNTVANLGGSWPVPVILYLMGRLNFPPTCKIIDGDEVCTGGRDAYLPLQIVLSILGCTWIYFMKDTVKWIESFPIEGWKTSLESDCDQKNRCDMNDVKIVDIEKKRKKCQ